MLLERTLVISLQGEEMQEESLKPVGIWMAGPLEVADEYPREVAGEYPSEVADEYSLEVADEYLGRIENTVEPSTSACLGLWLQGWFISPRSIFP